jgi:hypothetical protein
MELLFSERTCERCGKEFIVQDPGSYIYKRNDYQKWTAKAKTPRMKYFCSYSCMKAWLQERGQW